MEKNRKQLIKEAYENVLKVLDKKSTDSAFYGIIQKEYENGNMTYSEASEFYFNLTGKKHI